MLSIAPMLLQIFTIVSLTESIEFHRRLSTHPLEANRDAIARIRRVWIELDLDDALDGPRVPPNLDVLQPHRSEKITPLRLGPLHRRHQRHHRKVPLGLGPISIRGVHHNLVDDDLGVAALHRVFGLLQNLLGFGVQPVVQDVAEIVKSCACVPVNWTFMKSV